MTHAAVARRAELAGRLAELEQRIAAAAQRAGRAPAGIHLVAVTKTHPASDVEHLAALGVREVGESRDQEAQPKRAQVTADLRWHFLGRLQRNKARSVARWADVVQSVDRAELVAPLAAAAAEREQPLEVLLQVSLDGDPARGGALPAAIERLAEQVAAASSLRLGGVMAVAPLHEPAEAGFARLAAVAERLQAAHPDATTVSAGMSGDLEQAVAAGATHLRIGTALLGVRPPAVR